MITIFASAFTGLPANGSGQRPDNANAFVNLKPFPVYIDELSFTWSWTLPLAGANPRGTVSGDVVRARIHARRQPVTNGFVPVCLLARSKNWEANVPGSTLAQPGKSIASNFVWELPAPIYLAPGEKIDIWMQNQNDFVLGTPQAAVTVRVAARGRMAPRIPPRIDLPYATAFLSSIFGATTNPGAGGASSILPPVIFETGFTDLFNPFDEPFEVERMIYEVSQTAPVVGLTTATVSPVDGTAPGPYSSGTGFSALSAPLDRRNLKVKMKDQDSNPIIRDFAPLAAVFSPQDRSWPVNSVLGPREYYKAFFQLQLPSFVDQYAAESFGARVGMSLVGSRRLA